MDAEGKPLAANLVEQVPFLVLGMDLPPAPLYKDALERNIIPQVPACLEQSMGPQVPLPVYTSYAATVRWVSSLISSMGCPDCKLQLSSYACAGAYF